MIPEVGRGIGEGAVTDSLFLERRDNQGLKGRRSKGFRVVTMSQQRCKVRGLSNGESTMGKSADFVVNAKANRKPVKGLEDGRCVGTMRCP